MKTLSRSLSGLLLATTALVAPVAAFAQTQPAPGQDPEVTAVDEIVILGRYIPEPLRETPQVSAILTSEDLARQGDDNAAAAVTRLTGLSIAEGRFVYVRGLGERYSSALLNGSPLPSPEPLQRVVPLDLFPSSILQTVLVQKTYSSEFPGEFGGGVIDLRTVTTPINPFLNFSIGTGGNTATTFQSGFTHYGSDTDFFGFDDGTRKMPLPLRQAIATGLRVNQANFSDDDLQFIGQSFRNAPLNLIQRTDTVPANLSLGLSGGRSFDLGRGQLGVIGVFGFSNSWTTRNGVQQEGRIDIDELVPLTDFGFSSTQNDVRLNALGGFGLEWGAGNEVRWTNLYVRNTTKETRVREGNDDLAGRIVRDDFTAWYERQLFSTQLTGAHMLMPSLDLGWRIAYATTSRDAPYEKQIRYRLDDGIYYHDSSQQRNSTRFSTLDDDTFSGGAEIAYTTGFIGGREATFTVGADALRNTRDSESREFRFVALNVPLPLEVQRTRVDFLLADFNIRPDALVLQETTGADGAAAYSGELEVRAGFAKADIDIMPTVRASLGVRYEDATQTVTPIDIFTGAALPGAAPLENSYWLPSATLTWNFAENMQLRLGASRTIGRPQFRELAPQQYLDPDSDRLFIGNPFLVDTELTNLDARVEYYFAPQQYVIGGVFYKDIDRPVEAAVNDAGATVQQTYLNAPNARIWGVELEGKVYFDLNPDWGFIGTRRWLLQANYTYTNSEVRASADDVVFPLVGGGAPRPALDYIINGSRLQGQSDHIFNIQFGWENAASGSQGTLLGTYVGERVSARGRPGEPDFIQEPGFMLDFVLRQDFTVWNRDLQFGFELRNILNTEYQEYQLLNDSRIDINRYDLGRSISFSLSTRF
ncbi:MAG: TonB-dependent receptor domain-containing protein [Brevundimonas sp.]|jgi:TonB-dependent receptor|uniref:TonB-dependent receptor domain-containing protein n=1 Tax=Brevundimonas sp. TaxID=1871086 RepID=UPI00391B8243